MTLNLISYQHSHVLRKETRTEPWWQSGLERQQSWRFRRMLEVGGSNPGHSKNLFSKCQDKNGSIVRDRDRLTQPRFLETIKVNVLGDLRSMLSHDTCGVRFVYAAPAEVKITYSEWVTRMAVVVAIQHQTWSGTIWQFAEEEGGQYDCGAQTSNWSTLQDQDS